MSEKKSMMKYLVEIEWAITEMVIEANDKEDAINKVFEKIASELAFMGKDDFLNYLDTQFQDVKAKKVVFDE